MNAFARTMLVPVCAVLAGHAAAQAAPGASAPLRPGLYSGAVTMSLVVGKGHPAVLSGAWSVTVDRLGHLRGREDLRGPVSFVSPDGDGCTYDPVTWTFGARGTLGTSYSGPGTPGVVRGNVVLLDLSTSWYTIPSSYARICGGIRSGWPLYVVVGGGGDTVTPVVATLRLPLSLFGRPGRSATVRLKSTWGVVYAQKYTLTRAPSAV